MFLFAGLVPLVVLATGLVGVPSLAHITVPITRDIGGNGMSNIVKRDREHLGNLVRRGRHRRQFTTSSKVANTPLNNTGSAYVATIKVGDPPTQYRLLVDTGSAITWVGANPQHPYVPTKTSVKTKDTVNTTYSNGFFTGTLYNDTVTIADGFTVTQQYIAAASKSSGFAPLDGVLGLGPYGLTLGLLFPDTNMIARTITDTLFHQQIIQKNQVAMSFEPTTSFPKVNGELTFGGDDPSRYKGGLNCFSLSVSKPANMYWSFDAVVGYGEDVILQLAPGVFDSGTTLFGLATSAYKIYVEKSGAVLDKTTGFLMITPAQYENLQPIMFNIDNRIYSLNANGQIWPRKLNSFIGGQDDMVYLIVNDLGPDVSEEFGIVAGLTFLERFYVVLDSRRHRTCLATTQYTDATDIN